MSQVKFDIFDKLVFLVNEKWRYKVAWGGRGGYKSWTFCIAILSLCMSRCVRVLCCREIQKSIQDSVYQTLIDRIEDMGVKDEFYITNNKIENRRTGAVIKFDGLRDATIDIKSKEGVDICWVEEAENLSKESFEKLYPTIRKEGSEIWISFNTTDVDAFVYEYFITNPPPNAKVVRTYWWENTKLSSTLREEALLCRTRDPQGYAHIWEGEPSKTGLRVYPWFDENIHVKHLDFNFLADHGNFFVGMDPHKTAYPAVLFGCSVPTNSDKTEFDYFIYNEYPTKQDLHSKLYYEVRKTAKCPHQQKALAGMFHALERNCGSIQRNDIDIILRGCDPYFAKGVGGDDWSSNTEGLVLEWARPENGGLNWTLPDRKILSVQRNTINELLRYNEQVSVSSINRPSLYIAPHCQNLITSMKLHRDSSEKDCEDEKHKDFSDALRILMAVMKYTPYRPKKDKRVVHQMTPLLNKNIFMRTTLGFGG